MMRSNKFKDRLNFQFTGYGKILKGVEIQLQKDVEDDGTVEQIKDMYDEIK